MSEDYTQITCKALAYLDGSDQNILIAIFLCWGERFDLRICRSSSQTSSPDIWSSSTRCWTHWVNSLALGIFLRLKWNRVNAKSINCKFKWPKTSRTAIIQCSLSSPDTPSMSAITGRVTMISSTQTCGI